MNNIFLTAAIISIIFCIGKFIEMKFIEKEVKPLKFLVRDMLLVYSCVIAGMLLIEQLSPVIDEIELKTVPVAFTDNPSF